MNEYSWLGRTAVLQLLIVYVGGGGGGGGRHSLSMREISLWDIKVYKIQKSGKKNNKKTLLLSFFFFQGLFKVSISCSNDNNTYSAITHKKYHDLLALHSTKSTTKQS